MKTKTKMLLLFALTLAVVVTACLVKPVPQALSYHNFADKNSIWGIPNFKNVITNLPFVLIGFYGLHLITKSTFYPFRIIYAVLFTGLILTGAGSAYYHLAPDNNSLVFDRMPMTIVFMSFLAATISGWINEKVGIILLVPLLIIGVGSVLWWHHTEMHAMGDLRWYGVVQFYPMILIPLIFLLFKSRENNKHLILLTGVIAWYILAKLLETYDVKVYKLTSIISGHSLKHIAAAIATWYIVQFFKKKYLVEKAIS